MHLLNSFQITNYQIDSRNIGPNGVFFALPGEKTDGHRFLKQAKEKGAIAAVVSKEYQGPHFGLYLLYVDDVKVHLQQMAKKRLSSFQNPIIGITGSIGKTMTKEFIWTLLSQKYHVAKTLQSHNTQLSLPIAILNQKKAPDLWVFEMGMSQPKDIAKLLDIIPLDIALITKIALSHAANFPNGIRDIAKEKGEIFNSPKLKKAIFDLEYLPHLDKREEVQYLSFSLDQKEAAYSLLRKGKNGILQTPNNRTISLALPFTEQHLLHNLTAALAICCEMELSDQEMKQGLLQLKLPSMRFEKITKNNVVFINDAYNANAISMQLALSQMPSPQQGGKKIAVLGSIKELGKFSEEEHQKVGRLAIQYIDHLLVLGEEAFPLFQEFKISQKPCQYFSSHKDLTDYLQTLIQSGDVILFKGSRSMQMETILTKILESTF